MILEVSRVRIRSLLPADLDWIWAEEVGTELGAHWRWNGSTPQRGEFIESLTRGVLAQAVVERRASGRPIGIVTGYDADMRSGTVSLAVMSAQPHDPMIFIGIGLFIQFLFDNWPVRMIQAECTARHYTQFDSIVRTGMWESQGVLRRHDFTDSGYQDRHLLILTRSVWETSSYAELLRSRMLRS